MLKKSERLAKDRDAIRNLKAVLNMKEKLDSNYPGKLVNGRPLLNPVPLKMHSTRTNSLTERDLILQTGSSPQ